MAKPVWFQCDFDNLFLLLYFFETLRLDNDFRLSLLNYTENMKIKCLKSSPTKKKLMKKIKQFYPFIELYVYNSNE